MDIPPLKIYIGEPIEGLPCLPFLRPSLSPGSVVLNTFSEPDAFSFIKTPFFEIVQDAGAADFLLIPHNYFHLRKNKELIVAFEEISEKSGKKILIFALGDRAGHVAVKNSIVFRTSQYRPDLRQNEIIIPAFVPDMLKDRSLNLRNKSAKAIVGFCGWAKFATIQDHIKFLIKNTFLRFGARKQGIYFRLKAIGVLALSPLVETDFIIRSSHSGSKKTIIGDPAAARKEYIDNILNSDFVLAPKGDGNYSVRFYEALSLARIPLLIDTETILPLEKTLCYDEFALRVDYRRIHKLPEIVSAFYSGLSDEQFALMQEKAREAYEKFLGPDVFLRRIFTKEFLDSYQ